MIPFETGKLTAIPSRKEKVAVQLTAIARQQTSPDQQIQDRHAEGRPRLAMLDDQLYELNLKREQLARELLTSEEPAEDFQRKREAEGTV